MARDYRNLLRDDGIFVPRKVLVLVGLLLLAWVALRILVPPSWIVQRLDSPDGRRSALLTRSQYLRQSFVVLVKDGRLWHTSYYSPPITNDFRVDLNERLVWSPDSRRVHLAVRDAVVWGYDFVEKRDLAPAEFIPAETK